MKKMAKTQLAMANVPVRSVRSRRMSARRRRYLRRQFLFKSMMILMIATLASFAIWITKAIFTEAHEKNAEPEETAVIRIYSEEISITQNSAPRDAELQQVTQDALEQMMVEIPEETKAPSPTLSYEGPGEDYYYIINEDEKIMIAKVIWKEARGESFEGQVAVAATVFNRLNSDDPAIDNESIYSVIHQSGAYASISDVTTEDAYTCMDAVEAACKGYDPTRACFPNGARFFYNPTWTGEEELARREGVEKMVIGNHTFHDSFAY